MKYLDIGQCRGGIEPADRLTFGDRPRIPFACHHDAHRRGIPPAGRRAGFKLTIHGGIEQFEKARVEPHQQRFAFWVAEAGVELQHLRSLGGEHQPGVEHALKRGFRPPHGMHRGHEDSGLDLREQRIVDERGRGIRSHAARVGPFVAVVGGLMILERRKCDDRAAVGDRQHAHLDAVETFLDEDAAGGRGQCGIVGDRLDGGECGGPVAAHEHALASRQPIRLDDDRHVFAGFEVFAGPCRRPKLAEHGRRNVATMEDLLAVRLAALDLSGPLRGAEDPLAGRRELIDDAGNESCLRTDDREIDTAAASHLEQPGDVSRRDGHVFGDCCGAGVARRHKHLRAVLGQFPGDGMLPAATSHDKNAAGHGHGAGSWQAGWETGDRHDRWRRRPLRSLGCGTAPSGSGSFGSVVVPKCGTVRTSTTTAAT